MRRLVLSSAFLVPSLLAASTAHAQPFERVADPFPVADLDGTAYADPFTGGILEPKPALVDLDADGTAELVLNVGGAGLQVYALQDGAWRLRDDRLGGVEPNTWAVFGDLDGDGDPDLLVRGEPGRVAYWENVGTATDPRFAAGEAVLMAQDGEPVRIEDSSQPGLADIDGDGDLDLLAGKADLGTITLYENTGVQDGQPVFAFVTDTFQDIAIYEDNPACTAPAATIETGSGPSAPEATPRHGANAIALPDLNGDGAPELFWGDFFAQSLFYFLNVGTPQAPAYRLESERFPVADPLLSGGYNASSFGDADGDGDPDLVVGVLRGLCFAAGSVVSNLIAYENTGTPQDPSYALRTARLIPTFDVGVRSTLAAGDLDGDGDLDLVVANEAAVDGQTAATLALVRNEGTADAPALRMESDRWIGLDYDFGGYAPTLADWDADGDLDLVVGGFNGRFAYLPNTGTPTAPQFDAAPADTRWQGIDTGQYGRAAAGDLDGDGDLDLVTGASSGRVRVYRNEGTPQVASFSAETNGAPVAADLAYAQTIGLPDDIGEDSSPALGDLDGDGDLDLLIGTAAGPILIYRNVGTAQAPRFEADGEMPTSRRRVAPLLLDLAGDDRPELLAGTNAGGLLYWAAGEGTSARPVPPSGALGLQVIPNPSAGSVIVRTSRPARGEVVVFDARGRAVRTLGLSGRETEWDGRGADGVRVPAGVYLVQLRSGHRVAIAPAVRI